MWFQSGPYLGGALIHQPSVRNQPASLSAFCHIEAEVCFIEMPRSNHLPFWRPLYDIAVWQFILMTGNKAKVKFTYNVHKVVANFLCKLLETRPLSHLKEKMMDEEVKAKTDNWMPRERATGKLTESCQDQWRRKELCYPSTDTAYSVNDHALVRWHASLFQLWGPLPWMQDRTRLEIPEEMSTANAILNFHEDR